jgi:cell division protein ZapA
MAHAVVTIAGRTYRMGCEEGEQARLGELASLVESKILALREGFGDIGEQRIVVMAALTLADEAATAIAKLGAVEAERDALRSAEASLREAEAALQEKIAATLEQAAARIEKVSRDLRKDGDDAGPLDLGPI